MPEQERVEGADDCDGAVMSMTADEIRKAREQYERQKALEAEQRELDRIRFCEKYGFD